MAKLCIHGELESRCDKIHPEEGIVCLVDFIPECDYCKTLRKLNKHHEIQPGPFDFASKQGPWAHGCEEHWRMFRAAPDLGVGKGQFWITA